MNFNHTKTASKVKTSTNVKTRNMNPDPTNQYIIRPHLFYHPNNPSPTHNTTSLHFKRLDQLQESPLWGCHHPFQFCSWWRFQNSSWTIHPASTMSHCRRFCLTTAIHRKQKLLISVSKLEVFYHHARWINELF